MQRLDSPHLNPGSCCLFLIALVVSPPGIVLTACLPIHKNGDIFSGIACVDMLMRDLIGDLTGFQNLDVVYTFMLDSAGECACVGEGRGRLK